MWFFKKKKTLSQEVIDDIKKEDVDMEGTEKPLKFFYV